MLGSNGLDDLGPFVDHRIRRFLEGRTVLAEVTGKSGTEVYVTRLRPGAQQEGPYASVASGVLQVGNLVQLQDADSGSPLVGWPVETSVRANYMTLVGADKDVAQTTSHTTYVELLRVDGLAIPADARFDVQWYAEVETVGGAGATAKQLRLVFNDALAVSITLTAGSATFWLPWVVSTAAEALTTPQRNALLLTDPSSAPATIAGLEEISSLSVEARTNDTGEGNDIVRVAELLVFA